jgi:trk system potassium uptake protein
LTVEVTPICRTAARRGTSSELFGEEAYQMQILIAGGGVVGNRLAVYLSQRGDKVTLIDSDKARCEWVSKNSDAIVYQGNALNPAILAEAEITKTDSLVVALGNDQIARELVRLAKGQFGVPKVVAVAKDSASKEKMEKLGADDVVVTEDIVLKEVKRILHRRGHRILYNDSAGDLKIEQVAVRATSDMLGKKVSVLGNKLAHVAGVIRGGKLVFPREEMELQMGDEVIVVGEELGVSKVCSQIEA